MPHPHAGCGTNVICARGVAPRQECSVANNSSKSPPGDVFHDGLGSLTATRAQLQYYPDDVWSYLLSGQWMRVSENDPFLGRCHELHDALREYLIAAHLVRDLIRLSLLRKWLGTAFAQLAIYRPARLLHEVLDNALQHAYAVVVNEFNQLALVDPVSTRVSPFHQRPYAVLHADRITEALCRP